VPEEKYSYTTVHVLQDDDNTLMIRIFTAMTFSPFKALASITAPCSVNAKGRLGEYFRLLK